MIYERFHITFVGVSRLWWTPSWSGICRLLADRLLHSDKFPSLSQAI